MFERIFGTVMIGLATAGVSYAGADYFRRGLDWVEADLRDKLRRLRIQIPMLRRYLVAWIGVVAVTFLFLWLGLSQLLLGLTLAAGLVCLPWYFVRRTAQRRQEQIEDQLADAMVSLSSAVKAGLSLGQALDILAQQTPVPICQEFRQIVGEYQLGKPLERCLAEAKERLQSENFALFVAAMEASRESGGRLNETVDRIAHSVRELQRLERKVVSETAQARASAFYMALAPPAVLAVYYFVVDPVNTALLFTSLWGQILLCAALVLNVAAYVWARAIMSADI